MFAGYIVTDGLTVFLFETDHSPALPLLQHTADFWGETRWQAESPGLIDQGHLSDDVVMETVEGNEQCTNPKWLSQQSLFGICVIFQPSILECPDLRLLLRIVAVQGSEVQV